MRINVVVRYDLESVATLKSLPECPYVHSKHGRGQSTLNFISSLNKDDNIHKSEALKLKDKRTLTLVKCQN